MLVGAFWAGKTTAQAIGSKQTLVDKLAERFNLNKDEVTGVFNELQEERQQQRQADMESKLDEAVNDGVITAEQKQVLLDKYAEMQKIQEQLNQKRKEMQQWMENSGIDFEKLAPYRIGFGGPGFGRLGFGRGHGFGGF